MTTMTTLLKPTTIPSPKKEHSLIGVAISGASLVVSTLILSGVVLYSAYSYIQTASFTKKAEAVQGCYEVAQIKKSTEGKGDTSTWSVEDVDINQNVVDSCLSKKGY